MANLDHHYTCDHEPLRWIWYKCPRRGCEKTRRATTAPMCPVHTRVLMKKK